MNQKQDKYYDDKLNQYEFIQYTGPKLYFYHNASRNAEDRILDADRSLPLLRRFLTSKNCPVTKLTINRCMILNRGILDILKENETITELSVTYCTISDRKFLNEVADFLKGNQTIKKLGLHLFRSYYGANNNNPEPRKLFKSLIGTSVTHFDHRT